MVRTCMPFSLAVLSPVAIAIAIVVAIADRVTVATAAVAVACHRKLKHPIVYFILLKESSDSHCLSIKLALVYVERSTSIRLNIFLNIQCATKR